jgi:hypothetical protein
MTEFDYIAEGHRRMRKRELAAVRAENVLIRFYHPGLSLKREKPAKVVTVRPPTMKERVAACFNGHPISRQEVFALLPGERSSTVRSALCELKAEGEIESVRYGVYQRRPTLNNRSRGR